MNSIGHIRSEKSLDPADADRENSSRRSDSGNQYCCVCHACWAHMSILATSDSSLPLVRRNSGRRALPTEGWKFALWSRLTCFRCSFPFSFLLI